jgi:RNA polymerase sigma factor (sigma-70 family)
MEDFLRETHYERQSEYELVNLARSGDQSAFEELFLRHRASALAWAHRLVQDANLIDEIVQDAWIRVLKHINKLKDDNLFAPWLRRIVWSQAMSLIDNRIKESQLVEVSSRLYADRSVVMESPEEQIMHNEAADWMKSLLLGCLTARELMIFSAYVFDGLSCKEIASLMNNEVSNVHNTISRSKKKARQARIHAYLDRYINTRRLEGRPEKIILIMPGHPIWKGDPR